MLCGQKGRQAWLLKTDSEGQREWEVVFEGHPDSEIKDNSFLRVLQTSDGGYALAAIQYAGGTHHSSYKTLYAVKTDEYGKEVWHRGLVAGAPYMPSCSVGDLLQTSDGGFYSSCDIRILSGASGGEAGRSRRDTVVPSILLD